MERTSGALLVHFYSQKHKMNTQTLLKHYVAIKRSIEQKQNEANHWRDRLAKALLNNGELSGAKLIKVRKTKVRSHLRRAFRYVRLS